VWKLHSDVADAPYSVILNQVANGVATRMAVLYSYRETPVETKEAFPAEDICNLL